MNNRLMLEDRRKRQGKIGEVVPCVDCGFKLTLTREKGMKGRGSRGQLKAVSEWLKKKIDFTYS